MIDVSLRVSAAPAATDTSEPEMNAATLNDSSPRQMLEWYQGKGRSLLEAGLSPVLLEQIDAQARQLLALVEKVPKAEVAFLGSTTAGKSTTVNALLRRRLLPENKIGSTTAAKVKITHGSAERLRIAYVEEAQIHRDLAELATEWERVDRDAAELGEQPDYRSIQRLHSVARCVLGLPANHSLIRSDLQRLVPPDITEKFGRTEEYTTELPKHVPDHLVGRYWAIVESAVLELPHDLLAEGLVIVDLPGTGDTDQGRLHALRQYVRQADQFVLVLGIALVTEDVERLLLETDLLLDLLKQRRPLVVVGTKLDTSGTPEPEQLAAWNLPPGLSGLRATEEMWRAKAEAQVLDLMKRLVTKIEPKAPDESDLDYDSRVRENFGRSSFIAVNPRAALELDPGTRGAATDATVLTWQEKYPGPNDSGVARLRSALSEIAAERRYEHETEVTAASAQFRDVIQSHLAHPGVRGVVATEHERERCREALKVAALKLSQLREDLREVGQEWIEGINEDLRNVESDSSEKGARRLENGLRNKHVSSVKASVRTPRNGVWNTIHLPKALFEPLQLRVVKEHWPRLRQQVENALARHDVVVRAFGDALEDATANSPDALQRSFAHLLSARRAVLKVHLETVRRDTLLEVDRLGLPLTDAIEKAARVAFGLPCSEAAQIHGAGTLQRITESLAGAAVGVGRATTATLRPEFERVATDLVSWLQVHLVDAGTKTIRAVGTDVERFLAGEAGETPSAAAVVEADTLLEELRNELASLPLAVVEADTLLGVHPDDAEERAAVKLSSAARAGSFAIEIGRGADGSAVVWEPARHGQPLNNFGLLVTGDSGAGKTQLLRALIAEVVRRRVPVCVFDFKNDYADEEFARAEGLAVHDVLRQGLPFNPLALAPDRFGKAQPMAHIHEIAGILQRVFKLGPLQTDRLRHGMRCAFEHRGIDATAHIPVTEDLAAPSFPEVVELLRQAGAPAENLLSHLSPLFDLGLFPAEPTAGMSFEAMLQRPTVLDLHELPNDRIKAALAEIIILRLHSQMLRGDQPRELRRLLVFDEAWRVGRSERLQELGREGRAFGIGIAIGTQFPGDLSDKLTGNLATQVMLLNTDVEHRRSVARQLCGSASGPDAVRLVNKIGALQKHQGYLRNSHYAPYILVETTPYYRRSWSNSAET